MTISIEPVNYTNLRYETGAPYLIEDVVGNGIRIPEVKKVVFVRLGSKVLLCAFKDEGRPVGLETDLMLAGVLAGLGTFDHGQTYDMNIVAESDAIYHTIHIEPAQP